MVASSSVCNHRNGASSGLASSRYFLTCSKPSKPKGIWMRFSISVSSGSVSIRSATFIICSLRWALSTRYATAFRAGNAARLSRRRTIWAGPAAGGDRLGNLCISGVELGESTALFSLSSDAGGGEGRGEESRFYWISALPNPLPARSSRGEGEDSLSPIPLIQWQWRQREGCRPGIEDGSDQRGRDFSPSPQPSPPRRGRGRVLRWRRTPACSFVVYLADSSVW